jgi:hypothetical protein
MPKPWQDLEKTRGKKIVQKAIRGMDAMEIARAFGLM